MSHPPEHPQGVGAAPGWGAPAADPDQGAGPGWGTPATPGVGAPGWSRQPGTPPPGPAPGAWGTPANGQGWGDAPGPAAGWSPGAPGTWGAGAATSAGSLPPLAGWGRRMAASLLDSLVYLVIVGLLAGGGIALGESIATDRGTSILTYVGPTDYTWVTVLIVIGAVLLAFGLFAALLPLCGGRSPGKAALGLRVHHVDGRRATLGRNLLRDVLVKWFLFYWVLGQCFVVWILDWLWPLWDERRQALHDKVVGTVVVHERADAAGAPAAEHDAFGR